jgi:hypothetical protein
VRSGQVEGAAVTALTSSLTALAGIAVSDFIAGKEATIAGLTEALRARLLLVAIVRAISAPSGVKRVEQLGQLLLPAAACLDVRRLGIEEGLSAILRCTPAVGHESSCSADFWLLGLSRSS